MISQSSIQELRINTKPIKLAASVLGALNHNLRQQILVLIDKNHSITVNEIRLKLKLEQSVTSQHLSILRHAGFVLTEREIYLLLFKS
jgi:DNA-binding transcriptional ArsR family regulator